MSAAFTRTVRYGFNNFKRQLNLSLATCLILVIATCLVGALFLTKDIVAFLIAEAKQKADISVYLKNECSSEEAFKLKEDLGRLSGVEEVEMRSQEEVLDDFIIKHRDDEELIESLREVGQNPFLASISIRAKETSDFEGIMSYLENEEIQSVVEKVDYHERKPVIEKIFDLTNFTEKAGLVLSIAFVVAAAIISFNTIRLTIQIQKKEISIMKLVGASNSFITGPFFVQALVVALISFIFSFSLIALGFYLLSSQISIVFPGLDVFSFFTGNMWKLAGAQIATALFLSIIPSLIAVRKYLKV